MVLTIASSGLDHVLIPNKNEWRSGSRQTVGQRVFLNWPELSRMADFISRLRYYINVAGPNTTKEGDAGILLKYSRLFCLAKWYTPSF
jgi:hypothetical protein